MSGLINSFLIEPVVRHARRFSGTNSPSSSSHDGVQPSHVRHATHTTSTTADLANRPPSAPLSSVNFGGDTDETSREKIQKRSHLDFPARRPATATGSAGEAATLSNSSPTPVKAVDDDDAGEFDRSINATNAQQEKFENHTNSQDGEQDLDPQQPEDTNRIPEVARENGFQGLIPMDDMRTNYVFAPDSTVSTSPMHVDDEVEQPIPLQASNGLGSAPVPTTAQDSAADSLQSMSLDSRLDESLRSMSLDDVPETSRNPSLNAVSSLRNQLSVSSSTSLHSRTSLDADHVSLAPSERSRASAEATSGELPADDGMSMLRQKLHKIRDMALSTEEKAKRMHALMVNDFKKFKGLASKSPLSSSQQQGNSRSRAASMTDAQETSPGSRRKSQSAESASKDGRVKPSSNSSTFDSIAHFDISPNDLKPTYQPRECALSEEVAVEDESFDENEELHLGCIHYKRNVKIQCADCRRWYTCRLCHDEAETHTLNRKKTKNMLCMLCGQPQPAAEYCRQCGELAANYYCDICKLWDNDTTRKIYHCHDCGICRRGEGLGKDYVHCKKCNVCISIAWAPTHRCVERATECDCPICGEWMFTSSASVVAMRCGHYIHRSCYDQYMKVSYKCPICNRSAVNMELQWRKLDRHIEAQPMPAQWQSTMVWVTCNDCAARCYTAYHWLGNKCNVCDSYNTNEVKIDNAPVEQAPALVDANGQPTHRPADPRALEDVPEPEGLRHGMNEIVSAPTAPPTPPTFSTDQEQLFMAVGDSASLNSLPDMVPTYCNETATPHSPPQPAYQIDTSECNKSSKTSAGSSQVKHNHGGGNLETYSHGQPRNITFEGNAPKRLNDLAHSDQELASTLSGAPHSPASLLGLAGPSSPAPASMPLPSSPPFVGSPLGEAVASSSSRDYDSEDEVDDYDSEEEITFWGSMAISPSSWGVSIPSVSMPTMNIPSVSLPGPISVGWAGSPGFFSGVWGGGAAASPATATATTAASGGVGIQRASGAAVTKEAASRSMRSFESLRSGASSGISRFWQMNVSSAEEEDEDDGVGGGGGTTAHGGHCAHGDIESCSASSNGDEEEEDDDDDDDDYDDEEEDDEEGEAEAGDEDGMDIFGHR